MPVSIFRFLWRCWQFHQFFLFCPTKSGLRFAEALCTTLHQISHKAFFYCLPCQAFLEIRQHYYSVIFLFFISSLVLDYIWSTFTDEQLRAEAKLLRQGFGFFKLVGPNISVCALNDEKMIVDGNLSLTAVDDVLIRIFHSHFVLPSGVLIISFTKLVVNPVI